MLRLQEGGAAVQHEDPNITLITPTAPMSPDTHGGRAKCLQRLVRLDLPVPQTVALSFDAVRAIAHGTLPDMSALVGVFDQNRLLCVRPSSQDPDWGGPGAILNIGLNEQTHADLAAVIGKKAADQAYLRFIQSYSQHVARLDPDMFDDVDFSKSDALDDVLDIYKHEADEPFPQDVSEQLSAVLKSMARAWEGTSARLLRLAKGAPADAGLGLVVQTMALGVGRGESGSGVVQLVDTLTGNAQISGRYLSQSQGRDALAAGDKSLFLQRDARGPSLQELLPDVYDELLEHAHLMRRRLREEMHVEFTVENGKLYLLDGVRVPRSARAAVNIAVALAEDKVITPQEAVMRIEPRSLNELLHRQVDPSAKRDMIGTGVAASPGAATGKIVFSANEAQAMAARGEPCVLVRRETSPEDIRGMHAAAAVVTERGGITSHAAVIGRGLGLPCVVGANSMRFQIRSKTLTSNDGRTFGEGDLITVDGTNGQILAGAPDMLEAALDTPFKKLMAWADDSRDIAIRANADTPADAQTAKNFDAEGIGLCRTEHMFFEEDRLTVMREMIFADEGTDRAAALERLLPMQRRDFTYLFQIMQGKPVCIRLFDPPLHEFLPTDRTGVRHLADALNLPVSRVERRIEALSEYNPMLGMRGVRLGITVPEIYEMQARAIFEATIDASADGAPIVPEIMLPLVSAKREVELVKTRVDAVAAAVRNERNVDFDYRLGVMVETPRAALRAEDIAPSCHFFSFGTNDLTQMTYGLSRDDAGRFMSEYVRQGVFHEDPFHTMDLEGVGELVQLGAQRGRSARPDIVLSVCGEHGGNPESIAFCRTIGMDYVSCSPFRVPVAMLAAAQLAIADKIG